MKKLAIIATAALTLFGCGWRQKAIEDPVQIAAIEKAVPNIGWYKNADGTVPLTASNRQLMAAVTELDVSECGLTSFDAVRHFTGLTTLRCAGNRLTELDLRPLKALTSVDCSYNILTSLEVGGLQKLTELNAYANKLTALRLSGCLSLTTLMCAENLLTSLNLSGLPVLRTLSCFNNRLETLNTAALPQLTYLNCSGNRLQRLDLSSNTGLIYRFFCGAQTDGRGVDRDLNLTVSTEQKTVWDTRLSGESANRGVAVSVRP